MTVWSSRCRRLFRAVTTRTTGWALAVFCVCAAALSVLVVPYAHAHGWYPLNCCSGHDCFKVDAIEYLSDGGMIMKAGRISVTVPKGFYQQPSLDQHAHVCAYPNGRGEFLPRCVFLPAGV